MIKYFCNFCGEEIKFSKEDVNNGIYTPLYVIIGRNTGPSYPFKNMEQHLCLNCRDKLAEFIKMLGK